MSSYNLDEKSYALITETIKKKVELYQSNVLIRLFTNYSDDRKIIHNVKKVLRESGMQRKDKKQIVELINEDLKLNRKIERLGTMQSMFKYWHVIHSPFALVMLIIMVIHVGVTIAFGYRWIF